MGLKAKVSFKPLNYEPVCVNFIVKILIYGEKCIVLQ